MRKMAIVIPARGGSKGILRKNLKLLNDKPLIDYAIEAAIQCASRVAALPLRHVSFTSLIVTDGVTTGWDSNFNYIVPDQCDIVVSSEDGEIVEHVITKWSDKNVQMLIRPSVLSRDDVQVDEVINFVIRQLGGEYEAVCILQPTSPFRTEQHIFDAIKVFYSSGKKSSLISGYFSRKYQYTSTSSGHVVPMMHTPAYRPGRQQDERGLSTLPFVENGAIYCAWTDQIIKQRTFRYAPFIGFDMGYENSPDIDTETDWKLAEIMMKNKNDRK